MSDTSSLLTNGGSLTLNGDPSVGGVLGTGTIQTIGDVAEPVNTAPMPQDDSASLFEFGTMDVDVLANDSDPDGDALTIIAVAANNGSAYINENNTIRYDASFAGSDIINYTV